MMHLPCGLKALARLMGLSPVEVDREAIHELSREELHDYVASDAIVTRLLALRRWETAKLSIDAPTSLRDHQPALSPLPAS